MSVINVRLYMRGNDMHKNDRVIDLIDARYIFIARHCSNAKIYV